MCRQKLQQGHKMTICPIFIEFHYGLGILNEIDDISGAIERVDTHKATYKSSKRLYATYQNIVQ